MEKMHVDYVTLLRHTRAERLEHEMDPDKRAAIKMK